MKRFVLNIAVLAVLAVPSLAGGPMTVDAFSAKAKSFDQKSVVVTGKVTEFKAKESKKGNKYTTFVLAGTKAKVNIYLRQWMASPVKDGDVVVVTGMYAVSKKVGSQTFTNEIDATEVKGKPNGVKLAKAPKPAQAKKK